MSSGDHEKDELDAAQHREPLRVLIVDDDRRDVARFRAQLAAAETAFLVDDVGWLRSAIQSAALRAASKHPYDVVLLDLYLPNGAGIDVAAEFLRCHPLLPVLVTTSERSLHVAQQCVFHGAQDYVVKETTTADELELALLKAIARKQATLVNKALSHSSFKAVGNEPADASGVRGHVAEVDATLREVLGYVARNVPEHLPAARSILERRGYGAVLYDLAETLEVGGERWDDETPTEGARRARKSSDTALRIVRSVIERNSRPAPGVKAATRPSSPTEARAIMLGVIERNRRKIRGFGL
jgi:CheY-like chemotaxis protein